MKTKKKFPVAKKTPGVLDDSVISVALVMYNDGDRVKSAILKLNEILTKNFTYFEILLIDNGSSDDTQKIIKNLLPIQMNIRYLSLSRHYDIEIAYLALFENSIGDYVVLMDIADDSPTFIPQLISKSTSGFDIVTLEKNSPQKFSLKEKFVNIFLSRLSKAFLNFDALTEVSAYRVFSRRAVNSLIQFRSKRRSLKYLNTIMGFKQTSIKFQQKNAVKTKQSLSVVKSLLLATDVIISNSTAPLRLAAMLGMLASFISLLYICYVFIITLVKRHIAEGWITTSILNSSMFFLLFLILVILAEYIDRIVHETKEQPMYLIKEELSSADLPGIRNKLNVE